MFVSEKNAYIKDLNALRIFNEFSMYLFSWKRGGGVPLND